MSYIGSTPTTQSFISGTDYFNGDGTTVAFTLSRRVASVNDIEVLVNNVEQQPNTVYTISGTTLTFTTAPSAGTQNIYVRYLSTVTQSMVPSQGTVNTAQLGLITTIPTTGGNTITLPASTGTVALTSQIPVAGSGPAFAACGSAMQSIPNSAWTKIAYNTKIFDTANCYDATTNYRFTPTVAGYYQINAQVLMAIGASTTIYYMQIYKNGAAYLYATGVTPNGTSQTIISGNGLIYCNGTTDYLEVFIYQSSGGTASCGSTGNLFQFSGFLARTA
jgi:hypothetical protein